MVSKTIGELDLPTPDQLEDVSVMVVPVEYTDSLGRKKNLQLSLGHLTRLVTKEAVGLSKVDNTSDLEKPLSILMQNALAEKLNASDAVTTEQLLAAIQDAIRNIPSPTITMDKVSGLEERLESLNKSEMIEGVKTLVDGLTRSALTREKVLEIINEVRPHQHSELTVGQNEWS